MTKNEHYNNEFQQEDDRSHKHSPCPSIANPTSRDLKKNESERSNKEKFMGSFPNDRSRESYQNALKQGSKHPIRLRNVEALLETLSTNRSDREETCWRQIRDLTWLLERGDDEQARVGAQALQTTLLHERQSSIFAERCYIFCDQILRDARGNNFTLWTKYAKQVAKAWGDQRDALLYAWALVVLGNLYRLHSCTEKEFDEDFAKQARDSLRLARQIAEGMGWRQNRRVANLVAFFATLYELRLITVHADCARSHDAERVAQAMRELAEELDAPHIHAELLREETSYLTLRGELGPAEVRWRALQEVGLPDDSPRACMRFLWAPINLLIAQEDEPQAQEKVDEFFGYRDYYPADNQYCLWQTWKRKRLSLPPGYDDFKSPQTFSLLLRPIYQEGSLLSF